MVEVKTRTNKYVYPEEKVNAKKIQKYRSICLNYLMHHSEIENIEFDVIAINVIDSKHGKICHIAGISEWDYL